MDLIRYLFSAGPSGVFMGIGAILAVVGTGIGFIGAVIKMFGGERTVFFVGGAIMVLGVVLAIASST